MTEIHNIYAVKLKVKCSSITFSTFVQKRTSILHSLHWPHTTLDIPFCAIILLYNMHGSSSCINIFTRTYQKAQMITHTHDVLNIYKQHTVCK